MPSKPFAYGGGLVNELVVPGQSVRVISWNADFTVYYLDFGLLGVILHALFSASYAGFVYKRI